MKIRPRNDCILFSPVDQVDTTAAGLIIPEVARRQPIEAEVIAVGPGRIAPDGRRLPMSVKPGDHVIVELYYTPFSFEGRQYGLLKEDDLGAVLPPTRQG